MSFLIVLSLLLSLVSATILQNGQVRITDYPDTTIASVAGNKYWKTYAPNSPQISYKGRWDSKYISWWSAPGLKFGFQSENVAISFGNYTSDGVLVAYRLDGQDWMFTNVTHSTTHLFITPETVGYNLTTPAGAMQTFELRVTNWAYGVQIAGVHLSANGALFKLPDFSKTIEVIGDSLSSGYTDTLEGLSSYAWGVGEGLGNVEFSITAYPGICLVDQDCWGNPRGQMYQWYQTSDTSPRAQALYGSNPEPWDFHAHPAADLVIINLGTNDNNTYNNVSGAVYYNDYIKFVTNIHEIWPNAQVILISLWNGFSQEGNTWRQGGAFIEDIENVYQHFKSDGFVHYFNTTGIMQHNDIGPLYHPTDVGHIKLAAHLMQYIKLQFGWIFAATGPEVQSGTLYWNDENAY